jgi:uncharacterized membrane protein YcaP (DUF421 family)
MYELKLNTERQTALRLKGETNIMKKRFSSLQKDIDEHKEVNKSENIKKESNNKLCPFVLLVPKLTH